jgi:hypothetical protein
MTVYDYFIKRNLVINYYYEKSTNSDMSFRYIPYDKNKEFKYEIII